MSKEDEYIKVVCIGDSLTEGDYGVKGKTGIANIHKENYPYFLAQCTGWTVLNFGKCGFRADAYLDYYKNGNVDVTGADVIVVMLGTNGGHSPTDNTPCNQALRELVKLLKRDAKNAEIVLCTPPPATVNKEYSNCGYMPQIRNAVLFVRVLSAEESIPLIDVYDSGVFTPETESTMQPNDGLHFCEDGYKALAHIIEQGIKSIMGWNVQQKLTDVSH